MIFINVSAKKTINLLTQHVLEDTGGLLRAPLTGDGAYHPCPHTERQLCHLLFNADVFANSILMVLLPRSKA